ncbi:hypothetical protein C8J56DRAFT_452982 [Mycena floridula]|nr:hypothetical protein C8J56DRAFT_452982 [Mycena floridula]
MPSVDDTPSASRYYWSDKSDLTITDFTKKYRPSMVENDGTKPWLWVKRCKPSKEDTGEKAAVEEAAPLLAELTKEVERIKTDASIPVRSNKKTGAKSKKELREEKQAEAAEELKAIALKHGYVSGKWLITASPEKIDAMWTKIAESLISGSLASTAAHLAKVSTTPADPGAHYQHVICLYLPDIFDKNAVIEVMRVLLGSLGANLTGVKSNLATDLGIDSKHPSGIQSTTWKNTALMEEAEIQDLKDFYWKSVSEGGVPVPAKKEEKGSASVKSKPKLKKKQVDDPFGSDEDDEEEKVKEVKVSKKKSAPVPKRAKESDEEEEEERPKKSTKK